jgi:hypothetical protein
MSVDSSGYVLRSGPGTPRLAIPILDRASILWNFLSSGRSNPSNLEDDLTNYHRVDVVNGGIRYQRSNNPLPPFAVTTMVTAAGSSDTEPRVAIDYRPNRPRRVHLLFTHAGSDVYTTWSDDDGLTWQTPAVWQSGARHPALASEMTTGLLLRSAYQGGNIIADRQYGGDASPASFTFRNDAGSNLAVEDDGYSLLLAPGHEARGWLLCRESGRGNVSLLYSVDQQYQSWHRVASLFTGGKHPQVALDPSTGQMALAAVVNNGIRIVRWDGQALVGSETNLLDDLGSAVQVEDDGFGMSFAWEQLLRLVFALNILGSGKTDDWWSADEHTAGPAIKRQNTD